MPLTSSETIDAAAWLIAQPCPAKRRSSIVPSSSTRSMHPQLVAAERVGVLELEVGRVDRRPSCGAACSARGSPRGRGCVHAQREPQPTIPHLVEAVDSASTSARVVCTANDARVVAATPRRFISGCAQWWPARTQTPSAAEDLGDVVRVGDVEREGDERAARVGVERAVDRQAGHLGEALERVGGRARARARARAPSRARRGSRRRRRGRSPRRSSACRPRTSRGTSAQRISSSATVGIMCPPPRNGGIASSSSRRPCRTPMPVGP